MASWFAGHGNDFNFHDDHALGPPAERSWFSYLGGDMLAVLKNAPKVFTDGSKMAARDVAADLDIDDPLSKKITQKLITQLWGSMLHPPLSYHGNEFRYRAADGSSNNIMYPGLGRAGAPYAKTVQPKRARQGAKPDPGDIFDLLLARNENSKDSASGISSFLLYHATLIIHDIFRTHDDDANKSATSSYLDLSPLYGCDLSAQMEVRQMTAGLLKPDTFAEDRLRRQPPGVCLYIVLYNRFHNYVAKQLLQINENGRFSLPEEPKDLCGSALDEWRRKALQQQDEDLFQTARLITCGMFMQISVHDYLRCLMLLHPKDTPWTMDPNRAYPGTDDKHGLQRGEGNMVSAEFNLLYRFHGPISRRDAEWTEDLFVGLARMGELIDDKASEQDIASGRKITTEMARNGEVPIPTIQKLFKGLKEKTKAEKEKQKTDRWFPPSLDPVGDRTGNFKRDQKTGLFDDAQIAAELYRVIEDPIVNFGGNVPKVLKAIEVLGIMQARKWEMASLNEFREFFGMSRHKHFSDINSDVNIQNKLRDLYENPDMVEFYPGVMLEGEGQKLDPGTMCPGKESSALWRAVFSDAVTLVRSDRFYTIDWNVDSYTSWGFKEVQSDPKVNKGSILNKLFIRALPNHFKYNGLHMWQPFYVPTMNAILAEEQGYINQLDLSGLEDELGAPWVVKNGNVASDYFKHACGPLAKKPRKIRRTMSIRDPKIGLKWRGNELAPTTKPVVTIADYATIQEILSDSKATKWAKASVIDPSDIPHPTFRAIVTGTWGSRSEKAVGIVRKTLPKGWEHTVAQYFDGLGNDIRLREQRSFQKTKCGDQTYQIDLVKDYAVPVITRFFADFLGFWNVVKTEQHKKRPYNENQIYAHISNCQRFNTRDSDPANLWKRRMAFRESIKFLIGLTENGAYSYEAGILEHGIFGSGILRIERDYSDDPVYVKNLRKLAVSLVQALNAGGFSTPEIAAILLAQVLGIGSSAVATFVESLAYFIDPMRRENKSIDDDERAKHWHELQKLSWTDAEVNASGTRVVCGNTVDHEIRKYALEAQRFNKVELVRVYRPEDKKAKPLKLANSTYDGLRITKSTVDVAVGDNVVLDIPNAYFTAGKAFPKPEIFDLKRSQSAYLNFGSSDMSRSGSIGQELTAIALTSLLKSTAQWKNLRVAHDKLGRLHRVCTPEGLTRYADVQWAELLPTPLTWNLRFDGLGKGVFTGGDNANQGHGMNQIWQPTTEFYSTGSLPVDASGSEPDSEASSASAGQDAYSTGFANGAELYSTGFHAEPQLVTGWGGDNGFAKAPVVSVTAVAEV